jgi:hypothetical protein
MIEVEKEVENRRVGRKNSGENHNERQESVEGQLRGTKDIIRTPFYHLILRVRFSLSFSLRT